MDIAQPKLRRIVEQVLADQGKVAFATLLEALVPVTRLRAVARAHGLTPKGGFRLEKAPARVLAPLLAEVRDVKALDDVVAALAGAVAGGDSAADEDAGGGAGGSKAADSPASATETSPTLRLKEEQLARASEELERARASLARAEERERELRAQLEQAEAAGRRGKARPEQPAAPSNHGDGDRASEREQRIRDLEQEVEGLDAANDALRRQAAHDHSVMQDLRSELAELEALLPKGKKRRKPVEPSPEPERRFLVPWFVESFYDSIRSKDRRSVERAVQAVLRFCTEGHAYPGLEVKQMHGQDLWSMRASLGLRVFFRHRGPNDIEILELVDREAQNTALRRHKDR